MSRTSRGGPSRHNFLQSLLMAAIALTGIGTVQAQSGAPAKISTVYTGDVSNGKKVVSSLSTSEPEPGK